MRIAAEAREKACQLFMHHGVTGNGMGELFHLRLGGQFAVEQQIAGLQEAGMFGEVGNGIAAILEHTLVAIDEGDVGLGGGGGGEAGVVGEDVRLVIELADVHHIGALGARKDRQFVILAFIVKAGFTCRLDLAFAHGPLPATPVFLHCNISGLSLTRHLICGLQRPNFRHSAYALRRNRDSSRPSSANIAKRGGETVLPVKAARRGWATSPSLRPPASAKARAASSRAGPLQSVASSWGRVRDSSARAWGERSLAAAASRSRGPSVYRNSAA